MGESRKERVGGLRWSVRTRILATILLVTAIGMTIAGSTAYLVQRDRILQSIDDRLMHSVEAVRTIVLGPEHTATTGDAKMPETPGFPSTDAALEAILARVLPERHESSLGIVDDTPRYVSVADVDFRLEDDPTFLSRVLDEISDDSIRLGTYVGDLGNLRYVAVPIDVADSPSSGVFVTAIDIDAELGELTTAFRTYAWVAALALIAVGLIGWFVSGRLLKPIRVLRETASRITGSDLRERIPVRGNDDVSALTATVNDMLERIDSAITSQQQLLDDVRHELKTPVTIVRGHLELLDADNAEDVVETRALLLDELDRMSSLIDDIELLAWGADRELDLETANVADLGRQIHSKASAIPGHTWLLAIDDASEDTTMLLDHARVTQAVLQLADNAAKYSNPDSPITVGCAAALDHAEFFVQDEGPGIPPEAQERIFDRFGRADAGRGVAGSGLGLSIVQTIAAAHGGSVSLASSPSGSRFTIRIPRTAMQEDT